jgi:hypothetical protein
MRRMHWTTALITAALSAAPASVARAEDGLLSENLEAVTGLRAEAVRSLDDAELAQLRGREQVYFDIDVHLFGKLGPRGALEGAAFGVESRRTESASPLPVDPEASPAPTGLQPSSTTTVFAAHSREGTRFASIGSGAFRDARGLMTAIQVPGDHNTIISQIQVQIFFLGGADRGVAALRGANQSRALGGF